MNKRKFLNKTLLFVLAAVLFFATAIAVFLDDSETLGENSQIIRVEGESELTQWMEEHSLGGKDGKEFVKYTFRTKSYLKEHFEKHGAETGCETAEEYQDKASDVVNSTKALFKVEKEDGDGVFYIEETNEIVFLSQDGFIRSYFCPSAGKAYFNKQ